jgi:hypothetical protein
MRGDDGILLLCPAVPHLSPPPRGAVGGGGRRPLLVVAQPLILGGRDVLASCHARPREEKRRSRRQCEQCGGQSGEPAGRAHRRQSLNRCCTGVTCDEREGRAGVGGVLKKYCHFTPLHNELVTLFIFSGVL